MFPVQQLAHLAVFAQVVRSRSFTRAARVLGVSKSVVSSQVQSLEKALGVKLLERSTRTVALTQAGEGVFASAERLLSCAEEVATTAEAHRDSVIGTLRVATAHALAATMVTPVLARLCSAHPSLNVELICDDAPIDLARERVDVAVRMGVFSDLKQAGFRVGAGSEIIIGAPELAADFESATKPSEMAEAPWVLHKCVDSDKRQEFSSREGQDALEHPKARAWTNSTLGMLELLRRGIGFGVLPYPIVQADLKSGRLTHVLPAWRRRAVGVYVVPGPGGGKSPQRTQLFVDALRATLHSGEFGNLFLQ